MVTAWLVAVAATGQPIFEKQVRVDPVGCRLPALKAAYPVNGTWQSVTIRIRCASKTDLNERKNWNGS